MGIECHAVISKLEIFTWSCGIELKSDNVESEQESLEWVLVDWSWWKFWFNDDDEIFVSSEIPESFEEDNDQEWHSLRSI